MIEENYVRLYATDFVRMAQRAETYGTDAGSIAKRTAEARAHATLMDARKGPGHLAALASRLRDEARHPRTTGRLGADEAQAIDRKYAFLNAVANDLDEGLPGLSPPDSARSADDDDNDRGGRIEDERISYEGVVVAPLAGGRCSIRLDNGHVVTAASPSGSSRVTALPGDRMRIAIAIHQSDGWVMAAPRRAGSWDDLERQPRAGMPVA